MCEAINDPEVVNLFSRTVILMGSLESAIIGIEPKVPLRI